MSAWLPAIQFILPYVSDIVKATIPIFTKPKDKGEVNAVIPNQIAELQDAVTHNAESIKQLATQLEQVVSGLDQGAEKLAQEIRLLKWIAIVAIVLSCTAIGLWIFAH